MTATDKSEIRLFEAEITDFGFDSFHEVMVCIVASDSDIDS